MSEPTVRFYLRASHPMDKSILKLHAGHRLLWERDLKVVKPSEMIVAEILWRKIGAAEDITFSLEPAPADHVGASEPELEEMA